MKLQISVISTMILLTTAPLNGFPIDNLGQPLTTACTHLPVQKFFNHEKFYIHHATIVTNPLYLLQAAKDTLTYINSHKKNRSSIINPPGFAKLLPMQTVIKTLNFIVSTIEHDKKTGNFRITDPAFVQKNFSCLAWHPDRHTAKKHGVHLTNDNIRLTSYAIFAVKGSKQKTANYPCALYALNNDAIRTKFTKQQILAGALEKSAYRNNCKALAWVSRQSLEDAIMHGTVVVNFKNGSSKVLRVNKHNNIPYNKNNKNMLTQKRYWFFKELKGSSRLSGNLIDRFKKRKQVIFAGDINHIGIGKVIAITHHNPLTHKKEMRIGILADTGGAFTNNLYQLDLFAGIINGHANYRNYLQQLPATTKACVLYKI